METLRATADPGEATRRFLEVAVDGPSAAPVASAAKATGAFKRYADTERLNLPDDRQEAPSASGPALIGHLLRHLLGIGRFGWAYDVPVQGEWSGAGQAVTVRVHRPVPSGGALYPVEAYLAGGSRGSPAGLYHYDRAHHALQCVRKGDHRTALLETLTAPPADRLGAYLRANPSRHPMNPDDYPRLAAGLAALERHPGYERRLLPPDTIRFIPYSPEHVSFGHGASLASVERHFHESTGVALDALWAPPPQRVSAAMVMTLAALLRLPADATPVGTRLLDQAGPMMNGPEPDTSDATEAEAAWTRSRSELSAMAERLRTADLSITPRIPALAWSRSVRELRDRLAALRRDGAFSSELPDPVAYALDRCLHLHLNRLGISLTQEARLRRMAVLTLRESETDRDVRC